MAAIAFQASHGFSLGCFVLFSSSMSSGSLFNTHPVKPLFPYASPTPCNTCWLPRILPRIPGTFLAILLMNFLCACSLALECMYTQACNIVGQPPSPPLPLLQTAARHTSNRQRREGGMENRSLSFDLSVPVSCLCLLMASSCLQQGMAAEASSAMPKGLCRTS